MFWSLHVFWSSNHQELRGAIPRLKGTQGTMDSVSGFVRLPKVGMNSRRSYGHSWVNVVKVHRTIVFVMKIVCTVLVALKSLNIRWFCPLWFVCIWCFHLNKLQRHMVTSLVVSSHFLWHCGCEKLHCLCDKLPSMKQQSKHNSCNPVQSWDQVKLCPT